MMRAEAAPARSPRRAAAPQKNRDRRALGRSAAILAGVGLVWFSRTASSVVIPFLLAVFISLCAYPVMGWMLRRRVPYLLALTLVVLGLLVVLGGAIILVWAGADQVASQAPAYQERIRGLWNEAASQLGLGAEQVRSLGRQAGGALGAVAASIAGSIANLAMQGILVFFFLIFLLSYRHWLPRGLGRAFGKAPAERAMRIIEDVESRSVHFLWLRTIVSVITAAGAWGIMVLFDVPSALLWTVVLFVGQYVPYFGPLLASAPPVLASLAQAPTPWTALWLAVALLGWGVLVGNLVEPRVMGKGMRLNELSVLLALSFFGWMWGVVGALLAVPMLVVLRIVCQQVHSLVPLAVLLGPRLKKDDTGG